nr:MAG TPA: hypothetical protein [Caudoviricetes sp.]
MTSAWDGSLNVVKFVMIQGELQPKIIDQNSTGINKRE